MRLILAGINTLFQWIETVLIGIIQTAWGALHLILDGLLGALVTVIGLLLNFVVSLLALVVSMMFAILPELPQAQHGGVGGVSALAAANQYVPIAETLALLPILATIFTAIGLYKLAKFIWIGGG
jgi:hypothetical protein